MKAMMWLSFDLGIRGDYELLYAWLDDQKAKECGPNLAFFTYSYKKDFMEELREDLDRVLDEDSRARIYVVHFVGKKSGAKGQWLFGGRKAAPWVGFGSGSEVEVDQ